MEGRKSPPKATHPYPSKANFNKFWGTPMAPAFVKLFGISFGIYTSLSIFYVWLSWDSPGILFNITPEQFEKRIEILKNNSILKSQYPTSQYNLPAMSWFPGDDVTSEKIELDLPPGRFH